MVLLVKKKLVAVTEYQIGILLWQRNYQKYGRCSLNLPIDTLLLKPKKQSLAAPILCNNTLLAQIIKITGHKKIYSTKIHQGCLRYSDDVRRWKPDWEKLKSGINDSQSILN